MASYPGIPPINTVALGQLIGASSASSMSALDEVSQFKGLTIRLVPATGGTIISIRSELSTVNHNDLYVIGSDDDIGQELGKIITMHYLKT